MVMGSVPPRRSDPTPADQVVDHCRDTLLDLPPKVDLRRRVPARDWPVWDQGTALSCTAHAVAGIVLYHRLRTGERPQFQPSRMFLFHREQRAVHQCGGSEPTVQNAMDVVRRDGFCADAPARGVPRDAVWGYSEDVAANPPKSCVAFAAQHRDRYAKYYLCQHLDHIRACLAEGNPFAVMIEVCAFGVGDRFHLQPGVPVMPASGDIEMPGRTWIRRCGRGDSLYNHAIVVVGYDDARQRFLIRNSLGTGWGRRGYGTIPYEYLLHTDLADQGWMLRPLAVPALRRAPRKRRPGSRASSRSRVTSRHRTS